MVESQNELVCRFRPDGMHLVVNEAHCRFFGVSHESFIGRRFRPVVPEEEEELLRVYFRFFSLDGPDGIEYRVISADGTTRWLQWNDRAFFDENGAIVEFQSVGRDMTEGWEAEEALSRLTAELEQRG